MPPPTPISPLAWFPWGTGLLGSEGGNPCPPASIYRPCFLYSCWLRVDNYFIWSFIGPVSFVIVVSWKVVPQYCVSILYPG